jgi:hypothetical protein
MGREDVRADAQRMSATVAPSPYGSQRVGDYIIRLLISDF